MEVISVKPLGKMASGAKFSAHVNEAGRHMTGFGKTEDEAIEDARRRLKGFKGLRKK